MNEENLQESRNLSAASILPEMTMEEMEADIARRMAENDEMTRKLQTDLAELRRRIKEGAKTDDPIKDYLWAAQGLFTQETLDRLHGLRDELSGKKLQQVLLVGCREESAMNSFVARDRDPGEFFLEVSLNLGVLEGDELIIDAPNEKFLLPARNGYVSMWGVEEKERSFCERNLSERSAFPLLLDHPLELINPRNRIWSVDPDRPVHLRLYIGNEKVYNFFRRYAAGRYREAYVGAAKMLGLTILMD